jgi:MFS family permease
VSQRARPEGLSAYIAVTASYWAFMLTDGALRMLVLLHFHTLGFSPVQLAYLFVLYEIAGVVTNLSAGWIAARFGLTRTLYAGLGLQVVALLALTQLDPAWALGTSVAFVMLVQGASGVAKDLSKMSSKSAVKLLAPTEGDGLFRWVALLTGSKNAVKGLGFLLGAALLATAGFNAAVLGMAAVLAVILAVILVAMPSGLPTGRKGAKFSEVFSKSPNVNWLSAARVTLFGARDVWFCRGHPDLLLRRPVGRNRRGQPRPPRRSWSWPRPGRQVSSGPRRRNGSRPGAGRRVGVSRPEMAICPAKLVMLMCRLLTQRHPGN